MLTVKKEKKKEKRKLSLGKHYLNQTYIHMCIYRNGFNNSTLPERY